MLTTFAGLHNVLMHNRGDCCSHKLVTVLERDVHLRAKLFSGFQIYYIYQKYKIENLTPFILYVLYEFGSHAHIQSLVQSIII